MVPASFIICFLLLSIEEIGVQIEEPFGILPLGKQPVALHVPRSLQPPCPVHVWDMFNSSTLLPSCLSVLQHDWN